jgi:hypothetical protein
LKRGTLEARFWKWFVANSDRLFHFEREQEQVFDELLTQLHHVAVGLTFEIGQIDGGKRELVVSADGDRNLFPHVERLVTASPALTRWRVTAFRPPLPIGFVIEMGDHRLGPDNIWFTAEPDADLTGLVLYIRDLNSTNDAILGNAAYILLDTALGEYAVETLVGFIERRSLPADPAASGLRPFHEIRGAIRDLGH